MEEIVHITPLGWERSRAIEPLKYVPARRVYLLYRPDHPLTLKFAGRVAAELTEQGVETKKTPLTETPGAVTQEFENLIFLLSKIVVTEHEKKNRIYLNISAAGKIAAAACYLVGMYHWDKIVSVYYARPAKYSVEDRDPKKAFDEWGLSIGMAGIEYLPVFKLGRPRNEGLWLLAEMYELGPLGYVDLLKTLKDHHDKMRAQGAKRTETVFADLNISKLSDSKKRPDALSEFNSWVARLKRQALDELLENQYVELKPSHEGPKKLVDLTRHGRYAALLSGFVTKVG
jgi:hypothetical protein